MRLRRVRLDARLGSFELSRSWVRLDRAAGGSVDAVHPFGPVGFVRIRELLGSVRNGRMSSNLPMIGPGVAPRLRGRRAIDRRAQAHVRWSCLHFRCGPADGAANGAWPLNDSVAVIGKNARDRKLQKCLSLGFVGGS
jgi:hypothetical protein